MLVNAEVLVSAYSILGFEPLHNFPFGISKLSKECSLTHLGADAFRSHPGKLMHEVKLISRMRTSTQRAVNSTIAAVKRD